MEKNRVLVKCGWCKAELSLTPSRIRLAKNGTSFCNRTCHAKWRTEHFVQPESMRRKTSERVSGSGNPSWKGDTARPQSGRARAERQYKNKRPCEVCGSEKSERHHKDFDTLNNSPENISFLCRAHHIQADRTRDAKGWLVSKRSM